MSVTGQKIDRNSGVLRVTLITLPELYPNSAPQGAAQNYYCLALDTKGLQIQVDLQALPPGVTLSQLQVNQVWWVEKRTTQYRLYLYGGMYEPSIRQVNSTAPLPTTSTGGVPTGTLLDFAGNVAPSGYLLCDGSSYSITTYSGLFSTIGYTFGGAGSNFNVPDMRGRVSVGAGSGTGLTSRTTGQTGGEETHTLTTGETPLAAHTHAVSVNGATVSNSNSYSLTSTGSTSTGSATVAGTMSSATTGVSASSSVSDPGHSHSLAGGGNYMSSVAGAFHTGTTTTTAMSQTTQNNATTGISVSTGISDPGHVHSLSGLSASVPSLTVSVAGTIPSSAFSFTVPTLSGSASANSATTASGHNNMQPFAVITKIIKY